VGHSRPSHNRWSFLSGSEPQATIARWCRDAGLADAVIDSQINTARRRKLNNLRRWSRSSFAIATARVWLVINSAEPSPRAEVRSSLL
jgi:hypothetical protein